MAFGRRPVNRVVRISKKGNNMKRTTTLLSLGLAGIMFVQVAEADQTGPLLTTHWGQRGGYAQYTPKKERLGCWSVALAQILYYHKVQPSGFVQYEGKGYKVAETLDHQFDWDLFVDRVSRSTPKQKQSEVARYCYYTAIAIGKDFVAEAAYKGNSDVRRKGISDYFGCPTRAYRNYRQGPEAVRKAILSELDQNRPLLLYVEGERGLGHAFVIDGARKAGDRFEVHLNCGWEGKDDGWYEFEKPIKTSRGLFDNSNRWVLAIRPKQEEGKEPASLARRPRGDLEEDLFSFAQRGFDRGVDVFGRLVGILCHVAKSP